MRGTKAGLQSDDLLLSFMSARSETEAERTLQMLLDEEVSPLILSILRRKLGIAVTGGRFEGQDQADFSELRSDVLIQVIGRLQEGRRGEDGGRIGDIRAYVSTVAYNAVNLYFRKKYPRRFSLENNLRYLLDRRQGLALWQGSHGEWVAGLAVWRDNKKADHSPKLRQLRENPAAFGRAALEADKTHSADPARQVADVLCHVGHPLELGDLVSVMGALWGVKDIPIETLPVDDSSLNNDTKDTVAESVLGKVGLRRYWVELCQLPPRHCAALLLQARDQEGNSILELFELEGVASFTEMAAAMALSVDELAALWNGIPMDDLRIATLLGVTAQHVARTRMIARRRIAERMLHV